MVGGGGWIDVLHFVQSCTHAGTVSNHIGTVNAAQWHATDPSKATRSLRNVFCLAECSPLHTLVLGPESFLWKLHSLVHGSVLMQPEIGGGTQKNLHVFFFLPAIRTFWRLYFIWMDGCLSWVSKLYKSHNKRQDVWGPVCETCVCNSPTQKERWNILNISALIHTQVAVGSLKGWARLLSQKTIFCFIHNRCLSVTITCAL